MKKRSSSAVVVNSNQRYALQTPRGDEFVSKCETTGNEAAKLHFTFTKDIKKAKTYTLEELRRDGILVAFVCGFSGAQLKKIE